MFSLNTVIEILQFVLNFLQEYQSLKGQPTTAPSTGTTPPAA